MKHKFVGGVLAVSFFMLIFVVSAKAQKTDFSGSWKLDLEKSVGIPPGMKQEMSVSQNGNTIKIETKVTMESDEKIVSDTYNLDGKEASYEARFPDAVPESSKRTSKWTEKGFEVVEKTEVNTPEGKAAIEMKRVWEISADGKTIVIEIEAKGPQGQQKIKRTFVKA